MNKRRRKKRDKKTWVVIRVDTSDENRTVTFGSLYDWKKENESKQIHTTPRK